jgi:hypothetical protein
MGGRQRYQLAAFESHTVSSAFDAVLDVAMDMAMESEAFDAALDAALDAGPQNVTFDEAFDAAFPVAQDAVFDVAYDNAKLWMTVLAKARAWARAQKRGRRGAP